MSGWWAIEAETTRELLDMLRKLEWGWGAGEVLAVLDRLGWRLVLDLPGKGALARTPFDTGRDRVSIVYRDDRVRSVSIGIAGRGDMPRGRRGRNAG